MFLTLFACHAPEPGLVAVHAPVGSGLSAFLSTIGDPRIVVTEDADPSLSAARSAAEVSVAVVVDPAACAECFRVGETDGVYTVSGGARLGVRYGVSALLEALGWRFFHPMDSLLPDTLAEPDRSEFEAEQSPQVARRGLHLHTLHPIDGLYAYWTGESPERAAAISDWAVRNRANHLQWVALDDITRSPSRLAEWQEESAAAVAHAHEQGLTVGLGIQLFGTSNLQKAFDLVDAPADEASMRATMEARVAGIAAVDWDVYNLSFGEFSGVDPAEFIRAANLAWDVVHTRSPDAEMTATIHVGNYEDLRVEWEGVELQYYFLVQFADPRIVPWVHTVMYYNLVEDAGGAYGHDVFDEHRAFLADRLEAGAPVGYFPETAYWVAFDNSVPTYLPLYIRSRWEDLAAFPALEDQILFSSGWEWGYWQNDVVALRMAWATPDTWSDPLAHLLAPVDPDLAETVIALAEAEHTWLIEGRLAAYLAGRDDFIDLGDALGLHAQPDRPGFDELAALDPAVNAALVTALDAMAADFAAIVSPGGDDRWSREVADGLEVTTLRAQYIAALYAGATGATASDVAFASADSALASARIVVARRHGELHDSLGDLSGASGGGILTSTGENPTLYPYGYLRWANELCYWDREYAQASNFLRGTDLDEPACTL